jgi:hypothetical protein
MARRSSLRSAVKSCTSETAELDLIRKMSSRFCAQKTRHPARFSLRKNSDRKAR